MRAILLFLAYRLTFPLARLKAISRSLHRLALVITDAVCLGLTQSEFRVRQSHTNKGLQNKGLHEDALEGSA